MERSLQRDESYQPIRKAVRLVYVLTGIGLAVRGFYRRDLYKFMLSLSTLLLVPGIELIRRWTRWKGGWQMETYIYGFSLLGWTLGGAAAWYARFPGYDKLVHCLSGVFVSLLILVIYRVLENDPEHHRSNPAMESFFVFFGSMAVAGLFELCEFTLSSITGRDLQHVLDTGVTDTMGDMFVCMLGTLFLLALLHRARHGKPDVLTDAVDAFVRPNLPFELPAQIFHRDRMK